MTLIIPMGGLGKRFANTGYRELKPFITVDGKPIISHVLDMFPGEEKPVFICRDQHLDTLPLREQLLTLKPHASILKMQAQGEGPVPAIRQCYDSISDNEDVLITYCDYTGTWDYNAFKQTVKSSGVDGAIPAYIGFHPHLLGPDFYGHMRWKRDPATGLDILLEMQEKKAFTENKMQEYGAVGMYWFKTGALMKKYFDESIEKNARTGHEFFCSMPYNFMLRDGLKVWIPEMTQFCQWGTPQDLEEYESWSRAFAALSGKPKGKTNIPESREPTIKARNTTRENTLQTAAYWHDFFKSAPWHPYGK